MSEINSYNAFYFSNIFNTISLPPYTLNVIIQYREKSHIPQSFPLERKSSVQSVKAER